MIEVFGRLSALIPSQFYLQLPFHPILCLGQDAETIDSLETAFIHDLISPEKLADEYEAIVDANGFFQVAHRRIVESGLELQSVRSQPVVQGSAVIADDVVQLTGFFLVGKRRNIGQGIERPGALFLIFGSRTGRITRIGGQMDLGSRRDAGNRRFGHAGDGPGPCRGSFELLHGGLPCIYFHGGWHHNRYFCRSFAGSYLSGQEGKLSFQETDRLEHLRGVYLPVKLLL